MGSAEADLAEDALTGEQLGAEADHKAEHGQTAIPGFGKSNESVLGCGVGHGYCGLQKPIVTQRYVFGAVCEPLAVIGSIGLSGRR